MDRLEVKFSSVVQRGQKGTDVTVRLYRLSDPVVTADGTEPVVGISDVALRVGDADDGVLVQRKFLVVQFKPSLFTLTHQGHHLVD